MILTIFGLLSCGGPAIRGIAMQDDVTRAFDSIPKNELPKDLAGLHNVQWATATVLIGSEPQGEAAFEQLQKLGIKAIVSVDGANPEVQTAKKYGLRYIHIPIGYDEIPREALLALVRVGREIKSPVYVHCHQGRHRGPAAAAVLCLSNASLTPDQAIDLMKSAGTGLDYTGLWRDVKAFKAPAKQVRLPELVEVGKVESLAAVMAKLDRAFELVNLCAKSEWQAPAEHPDLTPKSVARLVQEGFGESTRHCGPDYPAEFHNWLKQSDELAEQLCNAIGNNDSVQATAVMEALKRKCTECHAKYRN
jgi:protein tyrosine phosphatase (PTP) superfamily phosphohydrolase (DUF442 family)